MILSILFKAIFYYFIFIAIKGLWNFYQGFKLIKQTTKAAYEQQNGGGFSGHTGAKKSAPQGGDVFEAEYKVVDPK